MVDVALIDRVEVIRGPSSSIYGSSAFFGVINVVTRRGGQLKGVELSTDAGSFDTYRSTASMGDRLDNGFEWLFSVANYDSAGAARLYVPEFDQRISANPQATNDGIAAGLDGERAFNVFTSLGYGDFDVTAFFSDRVKRVPTASFGTAFNDGREETTDYRGYVDVKFGHAFSAATATSSTTTTLITEPTRTKNPSQANCRRRRPSRTEASVSGSALSGNLPPGCWTAIR
jgi:outer membrane receptor for ferrienterochelin and colicins